MVKGFDFTAGISEQARVRYSAGYQFFSEGKNEYSLARQVGLSTSRADRRSRSLSGISFCRQEDAFLTMVGRWVDANMVKATASSLALVIDLQVQSMTGGRSRWTAIPYLPGIPAAFRTRRRGRAHRTRIASLR